MDELLSQFRVRIGDAGTAQTYEVTPDFGVKEITMPYPNLGITAVYKNSVLVSSTGYSLVGNKLVLAIPADGTSEYLIEYLSFKIPTSALEMYLNMACDQAADYTGEDFSFSDEEYYPDPMYNQLIVLLALKAYTLDRMSTTAGSMISWRDEEKSMTKSGSSSFQSAIDNLQSEINREFMKFSKPRVRSGGLIPREASEYPGDY